MNTRKQHNSETVGRPYVTVTLDASASFAAALESSPVSHFAVRHAIDSALVATIPRDGDFRAWAASADTDATAAALQERLTQGLHDAGLTFAHPSVLVGPEVRSIYITLLSQCRFGDETCVMHDKPLH